MSPFSSFLESQKVSGVGGGHAAQGGEVRVLVVASWAPGLPVKGAWGKVRNGSPGPRKIVPGLGEDTASKLVSQCA